MGYIGSVLLLIFNLSMVIKPDWYGITGSPAEASMKAMKYSFITVGFWWALFSQYSFYYLPTGKSLGKIDKRVILNGFFELRGV